jgi:hypothetical protein
MQEALGSIPTTAKKEKTEKEKRNESQALFLYIAFCHQQPWISHIKKSRHKGGGQMVDC